MSTHWQPGLTLEEIEKRVILEAMRCYHDKRSQVADSLGIAPRTLDYKLAKYKADADAAEAAKKQLQGSTSNA